VGKIVWGAVAFAVVAGCSGHSVAGRPCASSGCPVDYVCAYAFDGVARCMASCTINETVCHDGSRCLPLQPGPTHACYLGGNVPIGQTCMTDLDCTRTGICLQSASTGQTACFVGCNLDGSYACSGGHPCMPTLDGNNGYCSLTTSP
jgi:hypothetical protein